MGVLRERVKQRPDTFLFYGPPGIGKSELVAQFPKAVFLVDPQEDGVLDLQDVGTVNQDIPVYECKSYDDYMSSLESLLESDFRTVVTETLGGIEALLFNKAYIELGYKSWRAFESFAEGARSSVRWVRDIVDVFTALRDSGKTVVMTAHATTRNFSNALGEDYIKVYPDCTKYLWTPFAKWFKNIFYCDLDIVVDKDDRNITAKGKASDCGERLIHTAPNSNYEAKNRYRLPDTIPMGGSGKECFSNLCNEIRKAKKS